MKSKEEMMPTLAALLVAYVVGSTDISREVVLAFVVGVIVGTGVERLGTRSSRKPTTGKKPVAESTIRLMTRLAHQHKAVNLSQGFPNEPPPRKMRLAAAGALLAGEDEASAAAMAEALEAVAPEVAGAKDSLNQYSYPFGAPFLRAAIGSYYERFAPELKVDGETEVTVVMGATEGFAATMRALTEPGDGVAFFQPFHELYPSQVSIFHLRARAVTLRRGRDAWGFRESDLEAALKRSKLFLFNSPHNPTGHCFSRDELGTILRLCAKHDVTIVTDEIYEHMYLDGSKHVSIAQLEPADRSRVVIVNSVSKTCKATGWRLGWVVADAKNTAKIRGVHDQLVACCPTPLQYGVARLLSDATNDDHLRRMHVEYAEKRDALSKALANAGFVVDQVHGAYYILADYHSVEALRGKTPTEAAMHMTSVVRVACVPGDNFYLPPAKTDPNTGGKYLRFAFVRSLDVIQAAEANLRANL